MMFALKVVKINSKIINYQRSKSVKFTAALTGFKFESLDMKKLIICRKVKGKENVRKSRKTDVKRVLKGLKAN
jgi:hypothetical protein